jgi:hypothetical protein
MASGASLAIVVGVIALAVFAPSIARRVGESGEQTRTQYAIAAMRMFASEPFVGTGPGTWVIQRAAQTEVDEPDFVIPHAHNLELQTLAELGLTGAAAGGVVLASLGRLLRSAMRDPDPLRRRLGWVCFLALVYLGFHQLLDFYANMPAVLFAASVPVAFLDATSPRKATGSKGTTAITRRLASITMPIVVIAVSVGLLVNEVPASSSQQAVELADRGDWAAADAKARAAADVDPQIGSYSMVAGLTSVRAGDHLAAAGYFRSVAIATDLPEAWLDLAAEQLALGHQREAVTSLERAFRLGQQRPGVSMSVGALALRAGDNHLAVDGFTSLLARQPTAAADPWWSEQPERLAARDAAIARIHAAASGSVRWRVAMAMGESAVAHAIAATDQDAAFNALVIDAWDESKPAVEELAAECYASPMNPTRLTLCANVAARLRQQPWVDEMRDLLEVLQPDLSNGAGVIAIVDTPTVSDRLAGPTVPFWGVFTYRRPVPRNLIVPGVATLRLQ